MRLVAFALASGLALGSALPQEGDPAARKEAAVAPAPVELKREWPASGSVKVVETRGRLDGGFTLEYRLAWEPAGDGRTRLRFEEPALAQIDGIAADSPQVAIARRQRETQLLALCDFEIDAQGAFVGVLEVEAAVERAVDSCLRRRVYGRGEAERQRESLLAPRARYALVKPVRDLWEQWCGAWDGRSAGPGEGRKVELELPLGADSRPAPAVRTFVLVSSAPDKLALRLRTLQAGEAFTKVVDQLAAAQAAPGKGGRILACERDVEAEADFAPGLRLLRYSHVARARTQYEGEQDPRLEQESRSFVVDWSAPAAPAAGPAQAGDPPR